MNARTTPTVVRASAAAMTLPSAFATPAAGVAVFGDDLTLHAWSADLAAISGHPAGLLAAGTSLEAWVKFEAQRGDYGRGEVVLLAHQRVALLLGDEPCEQEHVLADGQVLHSSRERLAPSGFALRYEDISAPRRSRNRPHGGESSAALEISRLSHELQLRDRDLKEAFERQSVTAQVLKTISRSTFELQPVLETLIQNAVRLCAAESGVVHRFDGKLLRIEAAYNVSSEFRDFIEENPLEQGRGTAAGRAAFERRTVHIPDITTDPDYRYPASYTVGTVRSILGVPMVKAGIPTGVMTIWRNQVQPFTDRQIDLLTAFADQAAIAIENVRLLRELQVRSRELTDALEQQTATAEILRVISRAPTDLAPVFNAVAANAARLCDAPDVIIMTAEGEHLESAASVGLFGQTIASDLTIPINRSSVASRAVLERRTVHVDDLAAESDDEYPTGKALQRRYGHRTIVATPLLRGDVAVGVIVVLRPDVRPFTERQLSLLQTFADQAVIAIENARLFNEITEALEQQTATADILRVISSSPTDVRPVLEVVASTAARLCDASDAVILRIDGKSFEHAAHYGSVPIDADGFVIDRETVNGRSVLERRTIHVRDLAVEETEFPLGRTYATRLGFRTAVSTPLMREGQPVGTIHIRRAEVRPFSEKQIKLLETFAHQAAIAIENVRLFKELEARNREVSAALEQQTATSEILRVISRSPTDVQPVFDAIASAALALCRARVANVLTFDGKLLHLAARAVTIPEAADVARDAFPRPIGLETAAGRAILSRASAVIPDVLADKDYAAACHVPDTSGVRSFIGVPLMREGNPIGAIAVGRPEAGPIPEQQIALLQTFADQAVIAIENVRLFNEIREKGAQLELASRHKSQFLANMSHELRTPLNAIIGFARIVMRRSKEHLEPKQYENLEKILASGQHLLGLINTILDLSKIEAGHVEVNATEVELAPVLQQCLLTIEPLVRAEAVTLVTDFAAMLPRMYVDEDKLRQIVINLLSNAAKFTTQGSIRLRVSAAEQTITLAVTDTGFGIPNDKLDLIFEEFEQVDTSSTREYGGTGLGLAIARRLARLMGGDIRADSVSGSGSTFTLTLPQRYRPASLQ